MKQENSQVRPLDCSYSKPAVAAVTFPPPLSLRPCHGASSAINAGNATWGDVGDRGNHSGRVSTDTAVCKHGLHRHRGRRAWASPSPWASHSGLTVTAGVTHGRHHHDEGAETRASYFTIVRVPLLELRSDRKRPSRAPVTVPAVARYWSQELADPGTQD